MLKRTNLIPLFILSVAAGIHAPASARAVLSARAPGGFQSASMLANRTATTTDREQDGLVGPVRRVRTETAKLTSKAGQFVEGPRTVLETATYDIKGSKIDNQYFLVAGGSLTGKEVYKYDAKGNIVEMSLHNADGSVLSKESYTYEFDAVGNWIKMTTSVAVIEGGKINFEPTEITYRIIAYYLEDTVARMVAPAAPTVPAPAAAQPSPSPLNVAEKKSDTASVKAPAPAAATSSPASNNKPAATKPAPLLPEVASLDKSKVYAAANAPTGAANNNTAGSPAVKVDSEAPAKPLTQAPVKPISGGILNGKAVSLPKPVYSEIAKRARASGTVSVEVVIDVSGKVISAKAASGPTMLHDAAEKAAMQARFSPTLLSGQPVKVAGTIHYAFTLAQ